MNDVLDTLPKGDIMLGTMARPRKTPKDEADKPRQVSFKLTSENEAKLNDYMAALSVPPNVAPTISAVMNSALELFFDRYEKAHEGKRASHG